MASATGDSAKHSGPSRQAAYTNSSDAAATNAAASFVDMRPRGSSRLAVRGFRASVRASASGLNPMAALRAATIATRTQPIVAGGGSRTDAGPTPAPFPASSTPANANGSAKTEWLNLTNDA